MLSTLTAEAVTIDGIEGASALDEWPGSGVVSGGCSKCEWCMRAPSPERHPTVDCHLRFNADAMLHRDAVTVLFPGEPSRREVDLSAAHLELDRQNDGVNTEHRAAAYLCGGSSKGLHATRLTPRGKS